MGDKAAVAIKAAPPNAPAQMDASMTVITAHHPTNWRSTASYAKRDQRLAWLLLVPSAAMVIAVMIIPLGFAVFASFFQYSLGQEDKMVFVFLANYVKFFTDPVALRSLFNTFVFTIISLILCLTVGVGIAALLREINRPAANILRGIFAMPILISPIIVSLIWRYMYDPTYGLVYYLLGLIRLENFGGLTSSMT